MRRSEGHNRGYALGIETAFSTVSVCLYDLHSQAAVVLEELALAKGHAEILPIFLSNVFEKAGKEIALLKEISVSIGPGSFTGTRIGISAAKAVAAALDVPVFGVSTTTAFASLHFGAGSPIISAIDAGNGRLYLECFDASGHRISTLSLVDIAEAVRNLPSEEVIVTGTGAEALLREAIIRGVNVRLEGRTDTPGAEQIARVNATQISDPLAPEPIYFGNQYESSMKARL